MSEAKVKVRVSKTNTENNFFSNTQILQLKLMLLVVFAAQ